MCDKLLICSGQTGQEHESRSNGQLLYFSVYYTGVVCCMSVTIVYNECQKNTLQGPAEDNKLKTDTEVQCCFFCLSYQTLGGQPNRHTMVSFHNLFWHSVCISDVCVNVVWYASVVHISVLCIVSIVHFSRPCYRRRNKWWRMQPSFSCFTRYQHW